MLNKPRFDEAFAKVEAFYMSNAHECTVDKQGRILLPPMLREYASLQKDVVFASARQKFRIWDKAIWERFNQESEKDLLQNPHLFAGLNV